MTFDEKGYWNSRYGSRKGNSGLGSYGESAKNKADCINGLIKDNNVKSICELGCGDGNQLAMFCGYEIYHGYDISNIVIDKVKEKFKEDDTKTFYKNIDDFPKEKYDLALSLDVLYHLVNLEVYEEYIRHLFRLSDLVCIYATNSDHKSQCKHCLSREFGLYIEENFKNFRLKQSIIVNESMLGFWIYEKI